jgi:short-subunit dehydrogenase
MRKNIVITGASSGLGWGMAKEFAAQGRNLGLCARRTDQLNELKAELEALHPDIKVVVHALDVNDHPEVFRVFKQFKADFGQVDRIIVNAGMGKGASLGTGHFHANLQTAQTNFIGALAQSEAALEIFREQGNGHLVAISSMSALRGMRRALNTYAATKAGLASLFEGIRIDLLGTDIKVSTIYPGFIQTELNAKVKKAPFMVDLDTGSKQLAKAINKEPAKAFVPGWPWNLIGLVMKIMPLRWLAKMS